MASGTSTRGSSTRFSISLPRDLSKKFERVLREKGYGNRSLAIADMAREWVAGHRLEVGDAEGVGTITLVYDHHKHGLQEGLTGLQHHHTDTILSSMHVHLDHHNCLEVLVVRGRASRIKSLAEQLIAVKGVKHGKFTITGNGLHA